MVPYCTTFAAVFYSDLQLPVVNFCVGRVLQGVGKTFEGLQFMVIANVSSSLLLCSIGS